MFNPVLQSPLRALLQKPRGKAFTLTQQALAILRRYGSNAHVYLPGASGVAVSGLLTNNYTSSDGSSGYSAVDGVAGLVLDAMGTVGVELIPNFTTSIPVALNGNGVVTSYTATSITLTCTVAGTFGCTIPGTAQSTTNSSVIVSDVVTNSRATPIYFDAGGVTGVFGATTGTGKTCIVKPTTTAGISIYQTTASIGDTFTVANISYKQVTGIHATQATTAAKPAVRRGLYNLFVQSGTFTTTWEKAGVLSLASGFADPDGGTSAYKMTEATTTGSHYVLQTATPNAGYVTSVFVCKAAGRNRVKIRSEVTQVLLSTIFDLAAGTVTGNGTIAHLGDDWYLCAARSYGSGTGASGYHLIQTLGAGDAESYAGDGVSGVYIYRAGLFAGTLTAQQILAEGGIPLTTSAAASNPSAGRYWWGFDGSNDQLVCGSAPFQVADDFVLVGSLSQNTPSWPGCVTVDAGGGSAVTIGLDNAWHPQGYMNAGGTTLVLTASSTVLASSTNVVALSKVGTTVKLFHNGAVVSTGSSSAVGTGAWNSMRIGAQLVGGGYVNGAAGPQGAIKGTMSDSDVVALMRFVALNTQNGPVF